MIDKLYNFRFELFFFSLFLILFGSIFFPLEWFEDVLIPVLLLGNIVSGILLISKSKKLVYFFSILFVILFISYLRKVIFKTESNLLETTVSGMYMLFYSSVTFELMRQVWIASEIKKNVIIGLMCGYICLGLVFFFLFVTINRHVPDSFNGLLSEGSGSVKEDLMYFSYVTLLTIGYGEITPMGELAKKTAILTGLAGQFYLVILTAIIVGKYINQESSIKQIDKEV